MSFCSGSDGDIPDSCCAAHACSPAATFNNGHAGEVRGVFVNLTFQT